MKCVIPEISWHNRDPVLSLDIQPQTGDCYRLATGGADCHVVIWQLKALPIGTVNVEVVADLTRHQKAVNVVRWSPVTGQYLASADDDANIIIWQAKTDNIPLLEESSDKEIWQTYKILRGHKEDIYDLCWSPDSLKLLSGSIDNTAIVWDLTKGKHDYIMTIHKGFVQGVCWDPKGQYIATISSDRVCRLFDSSGRQLKTKTHKGKLPVPETHHFFNKDVKYFHDDTFKSYFRRLQFTPDGSLLIVPSGCIETDDCKNALYASFAFTIDSFTQPAAIFPSPKQSTLAIKCCPLLFELRPEGPEPIISLPYRMIIAVATDSDVILYDTQQTSPFAHFQKIHYTHLTDLTWSNDGLLLLASSTDGYCTLITFEPNELGTQYIKVDVEMENFLNISGCEELEKDECEINNEKIEIKDEIKKPKKPSFLEKWAGKGQKTKEKINVIKTKEKTDVTKTKKNTNVFVIEQNTVLDNKTDVKQGKRITPIKVSDVASGNNKRNSDVVAQPIAVRKKPRMLENFLKITPSKKCQKTKENPEACEVILDECEARDSWKCETETSKEKTPETSIIDITEETSLKDFNLKIENSNETNELSIDLNETTTTNNFSNNKTKESPIDLNNVKIQTKEINGSPIDKDKTIENAQNINSTCKTSTTEIQSDIKGSIVQQIMHKKRIPLITLSSPKCKKKLDK